MLEERNPAGRKPRADGLDATAARAMNVADVTVMPCNESLPRECTKALQRRGAEWLLVESDQGIASTMRQFGQPCTQMGMVRRSISGTYDKRRVESNPLFRRLMT